MNITTRSELANPHLIQIVVVHPESNQRSDKLYLEPCQEMDCWLKAFRSALDN
ncbi:hypothetical protein [Ornithinibacillus bavariensis]|uniref:Uncharacterized protein n=1 Tax=Ornithinibacillus bavariensis TaxID=545502 RepID=A0A920C990_9BACI|nr:hypothetical protein [Ornithinibacillus bavariensis]GIO28317.1 hypothetical protein J43TS3_29280 [Ornithinibacillus bavariensis]